MSLRYFSASPLSCKFQVYCCFFFVLLLRFEKSPTSTIGSTNIMPLPGSPISSSRYKASVTLWIMLLGNRIITSSSRALFLHAEQLHGVLRADTASMHDRPPPAPALNATSITSPAAVDDNSQFSVHTLFLQIFSVLLEKPALYRFHSLPSGPMSEKGNPLTMFV